MGLIYMKISPSGGKYIGKTTFPEEIRWNKHVNNAYTNSSTSYNTIFAKAIRKYGAENFTTQILENNIAEEELDERESFWIDYYKTYFLDNNHGYNMTRGGEGTIKYTPEFFLPYWNAGYSLTEMESILHASRHTISKYLKNIGITQQAIKERGMYVASKAKLNFDLDTAIDLWEQGKSTKEIANILKITDANDISRALKKFHNVSTVEIQKRGHEWSCQSRKLNNKKI